MNVIVHFLIALAQALVCAGAVALARLVFPAIPPNITPIVFVVSLVIVFGILRTVDSAGQMNLARGEK